MIRDFSGDLFGDGGVAKMLSRVLATKDSAIEATAGEVFGFVAGPERLGFNGSGGGARSGSELSHLRSKTRLAAHPLGSLAQISYIGTEDRLEIDSEKEGWWLSTMLPRSRDCSRSSLAGIVAAALDRNVRKECRPTRTLLAACQGGTWEGRYYSMHAFREDRKA